MKALLMLLTLIGCGLGAVAFALALFSMNPVIGIMFVFGVVIFLTNTGNGNI